ncbi:MAG: hypothetical protein NW201_15555 [Gemmatimonadales bacterium]|nr:hypothetical protein [Gemmatimonadales bacterium]
MTAAQAGPRAIARTPDALDALARGATVVPLPLAVFEVAGPGAFACLQGLVTCDLRAPADGVLSYGALLTPKGMITCDYWVLRLAESRFVLLAPPHGHAASLELFRARLPPRLAKVTDRTAEWATRALLGAGTGEALAAAGAPLPAGARGVEPRDGLLVASTAGWRGDAPPMVALVVGPAAEVEALDARLVAGGATAGAPDDLDALRVRRGWPALGAEIDERTLVQEVRYDEIGAVAYDKGCFIGQETVARLHFRGHTNRRMVALAWPGAPVAPGSAVRRDDKDVGSVRTQLALGERTEALALVRREVPEGEAVLLEDGRTAVLRPLPAAAGEG